MEGMEWSVQSSWGPACGLLQEHVTLNHVHSAGSADPQTNSSLTPGDRPRVLLLPGPESGPCELTVQFQQQLCHVHSIHVLSSAQTCEVYNHREGVTDAEYLCTIRAGVKIPTPNHKGVANCLIENSSDAEVLSGTGISSGTYWNPGGKEDSKVVLRGKVNFEGGEGHPEDDELQPSLERDSNLSIRSEGEIEGKCSLLGRADLPSCDEKADARLEVKLRRTGSGVTGSRGGFVARESLGADTPLGSQTDRSPQVKSRAGDFQHERSELSCERDEEEKSGCCSEDSTDWVESFPRKCVSPGVEEDEGKVELNRSEFYLVDSEEGARRRKELSESYLPGMDEGCGDNCRCVAGASKDSALLERHETISSSVASPSVELRKGSDEIHNPVHDSAEVGEPDRDDRSEELEVEHLVFVPKGRSMPGQEHPEEGGEVESRLSNGLPSLHKNANSDYAAVCENVKKADVRNSLVSTKPGDLAHTSKVCGDSLGHVSSLDKLLYEAEVEFENPDACKAVKLRLLSLREKGCVEIEQIVVTFSPGPPFTSCPFPGSMQQQPTQNGGAGSALLSMLLPGMLQMARSLPDSKKRIDSSEPVAWDGGVPVRPAGMQGGLGPNSQPLMPALMSRMGPGISSGREVKQDASTADVCQRLDRLESVCLRIETSLSRALESFDRRLQLLERRNDEEVRLAQALYQGVSSKAHDSGDPSSPALNPYAVFSAFSPSLPSVPGTFSPAYEYSKSGLISSLPSLPPYRKATQPNADTISPVSFSSVFSSTSTPLSMSVPYPSLSQAPSSSSSSPRSPPMSSPLPSSPSSSSPSSLSSTVLPPSTATSLMTPLGLPVLRPSPSPSGPVSTVPLQSSAAASAPPKPLLSVSLPLFQSADPSPLLSSDPVVPSSSSSSSSDGAILLSPSSALPSTMSSALPPWPVSLALPNHTVSSESSASTFTDKVWVDQLELPVSDDAALQQCPEGVGDQSESIQNRDQMSYAQLEAPAVPSSLPSVTVDEAWASAFKAFSGPVSSDMVSSPVSVVTIGDLSGNVSMAQKETSEGSNDATEEPLCGLDSKSKDQNGDPPFSVNASSLQEHGNHLQDDGISHGLLATRAEEVASGQHKELQIQKEEFTLSQQEVGLTQSEDNVPGQEEEILLRPREVPLSYESHDSLTSPGGRLRGPAMRDSHSLGQKVQNSFAMECSILPGNVCSTSECHPLETKPQDALDLDSLYKELGGAFWRGLTPSKINGSGMLHFPDVSSPVVKHNGVSTQAPERCIAQEEMPSEVPEKWDDPPYSHAFDDLFGSFSSNPPLAKGDHPLGPEVTWSTLLSSQRKEAAKPPLSNEVSLQRRTRASSGAPGTSSCEETHQHPPMETVMEDRESRVAKPSSDDFEEFFGNFVGAAASTACADSGGPREPLQAWSSEDGLEIVTHINSRPQPDPFEAFPVKPEPDLDPFPSVTSQVSPGVTTSATSSPPSVLGSASDPFKDLFVDEAVRPSLPSNNDLFLSLSSQISTGNAQSSVPPPSVSLHDPFEHLFGNQANPSLGYGIPRLALQDEDAFFSVPTHILQGGPRSAAVTPGITLELSGLSELLWDTESLGLPRSPSTTHAPDSHYPGELSSDLSFDGDTTSRFCSFESVSDYPSGLGLRAMGHANRLEGEDMIWYR